VTSTALEVVKAIKDTQKEGGMCDYRIVLEGEENHGEGSRKSVSPLSLRTARVKERGPE